MLYFGSALGSLLVSLFFISNWTTNIRYNLRGPTTELINISITPSNLQPKRPPMPPCQQSSLDARLAPSGRIGAGFFPAKRRGSIIAPSIASQSHSIPHSSSNCLTPACQSGAEKRPLLSRLETDRGLSNEHTVWSGPELASGSRCAKRRRSHRHNADQRHGVVPRQSDAY